MKSDGSDIDWGIKIEPSLTFGSYLMIHIGVWFFSSNAQLTENEWNYVLMEYKNKRVKLYINNVLDTETAIDMPIGNHDYDLYVIGQQAGITSCTPATIQIDELKIYNGDDVLSADPAGVDPKVMLEISNDGGASFGHEIWMSAGKVGKRLTRVRKNKLGWSRDRVYRISMSDPVKWIILGATEEVEVEND
jgi:hypothetical protein